MNANFYRAFEERHRGPRALIKSRLQVYLPFVEALRHLHRDFFVVDLGCGRGEWLELLRDNGVSALGVDLDDQMLAACRERDLPVETANALLWLTHRADASCNIVSAFHLVEHLPFDGLDQLVRQSLRVLRPGGLLILETPNPENIVVASNLFYLDPTHQRPLPLSLLAFLPEYHGFSRIKILRLHETKPFLDNRKLDLMDVLGGASPDYAVIAQQTGREAASPQLDDLFNQHYGVDTVTLAMHYDEQHEEQLQKNLQTVINEAKSMHAEAEAMHTEVEAMHNESQAAIAEILKQLEIIHTSRSWRLTAPLRTTAGISGILMSSITVWLTTNILGYPRRLLRTFLQYSLRLIDAHSSTKRIVVLLLQPFPLVKERLVNFTLNSTTTSCPNLAEEQPADLSPRQHRFFKEIQTKSKSPISPGGNDADCD